MRREDRTPTPKSLLRAAQYHTHLSRAKNWLEWLAEPCTCRTCKTEGVNIEHVPCPGGCNCATFKPKVCVRCKLPQVAVPVHHHDEFCRAEREALRNANGFYSRPFRPESGKMYVKVRNNAASFVGGWKYELSAMLLAVEGQWVEVETKYLFDDQYNIGPVHIPGFENNGFRLMEKDVVDIIGDVRPERKRCGWCGNNEPNEAYVCTGCGKDDHFQSLTNKNRRRFKR